MDGHRPAKMTADRLVAGWAFRDRFFAALFAVFRAKFGEIDKGTGGDVTIRANLCDVVVIHFRVTLGLAA